MSNKKTDSKATKAKADAPAKKEAKAPKADKKKKDEPVKDVPAEDAQAGEEVAGETETFESLHETMLKNIQTAYDLLKTMRTDCKRFLKIHQKDIKNSRKYRKSNRAGKENKKPSGFNKPTPVPKVLVDLLELDDGAELPRTKVTGLIYKYIKDNKLQNTKDKRQINPDNKLKKVFGLSDANKGDLTFYTLQKFIKKLYPAKADAPAEKAVAEPEAEAEAEEKPKAKAQGKKKPADKTADA